MAVSRVDDRPLMLPESVADIGDVAIGASRGEHADYAGIEAQAVAARRERAAGHPSRLRVLTTIGADAVALATAAALSVWLASALDGVAVMGRLTAPFEAEPYGGAFLFVLLTPVWLAALWTFGMYRDSGRSIGGLNPTEGLGGLTALTAAAWALLIGFVLVEGDGAPVGALIAVWGVAIFLVPLARWLSRLLLWSRRSFQERVLIVGAGEVGHAIAAKISKHPDYRLRLVGFLDDGEPRRNGQGGPRGTGHRRPRRPQARRRRAARRPRHRRLLAGAPQRLPARGARLHRGGRAGQHRAPPLRGGELAGPGRRRRGHPSARRRPRRAEPRQHGREARLRPRGRRYVLVSSSSR